MSSGVVFVKKRSKPESDEEEDQPPPCKLPRGCGGYREPIEWVHKSTYNNLKEALVAVGDNWNLQYSNGSVHSEKKIYYCLKDGKRCPVKKQLRLLNDGHEVAYFEAKCVDHIDLDDPTKTLSWEVKNQIREFIKNGTTGGLQILRLLGTVDNPPSVKQVNNFVAREKKKKSDGGGMSVGDLKEWVEQNSSLPDDENIAYVVNSVLPSNKSDTHLRIFLTTKLLLKCAMLTKCVMCDATYKLNYQGYPMIVVRVSDSNRVFHPCGIGICSGEAEEDYEFCFASVKSGLQHLELEYKPTVLGADTAHAITNGFQNIFGDNFARVVCWFHVKECFSKKLKEVKNTDLQTELQDDIELLHNCPTVESFQLGCKLWKMKWKTSKDPLVKSFVSYFISQWIEDNEGWFQGVAPGYPTTNNGMESFNALIKKYHTMRLRLTFNIFLARMKDMLHTHSCDRSGDSPRKLFATKATYPLKIQQNAYHWHDEIDSYYHKTMDNSITVIYVASSGHTPVSSAAVVTTETKVYRSFKTFKEHFFSFHKIYLNFNDWLLSSCSCVSYQEKLVCKHIYGLAVFNNLHAFSNQAIDIPLAGKPKRGRPAKVNVGRSKAQSQPSCSQTSKPSL